MRGKKPKEANLNGNLHQVIERFGNLLMPLISTERDPLRSYALGLSSAILAPNDEGAYASSIFHGGAISLQ